MRLLQYVGNSSPVCIVLTLNLWFILKVAFDIGIELFGEVELRKVLLLIIALFDGC